MGNSSSSVIPGTKGEVYFTDAEGEEKKYHYVVAKKGEKEKNKEEPALIFYPESVKDVQAAVNYGRQHNLSIAIRSGGHHYPVANHFQMDLSKVYAGPEEFTYDPESNRLRVGVSLTLEEFNRKLCELSLFVPHGQCPQDHIGGHVQTGGYGMLTRAFGLTGDHVVGLEVVTANGELKIVTRHETDKDLFYALLGGSPGNLAVMTHVIFAPLKDADYPNARGLKLACLYKSDTMKSLTETLLQISSDIDLPADYDIMISMLSASDEIFHFMPGLDNFIQENYPDVFSEPNHKLWPPFIMVWGQWSNLGGSSQAYDPSVFQRLKDACGAVTYTALFDETPRTISTLTTGWIYSNVTEFTLPYEKHCYATRSVPAADSSFPSWLADRVTWNCNIVYQLQFFGGQFSTFFKNKGNGTAYSWRDLQMILSIECFYGSSSPDSEETARDWVAACKEEAVGPTGCFSSEDLRMLWDAYGDRDMSQVWSLYYEESQFKRLCDIKQRIDPLNVFTANAFE